MNRLKALRVAAGYNSQRELAAAISRWANGNTDKEVSYASIARMEAGSDNPWWSNVNALARFFQVSADYLMGTEREEVKPDSGTREEIRLAAEDFAHRLVDILGGQPCENR